MLPPDIPPPGPGLPAGPAPGRGLPARPAPGSGRAADRGPRGRARDGWDGEAVLAGLDPDIAGLDPDALAGRTEPSEAELAGEYPPDDDDQFLAAAVGGVVFAEGGLAEVLEPGAAVAGLSQHALDDGLAALSDDALVGLLQASRRLSAWQCGIELAAVAELDHRRVRESGRPGWSRVSEHVGAELAAALVLTGRSADLLL